MRDWSLVSGDLAFSGDVGGHRGVVAAELGFGFRNIDGGVGFDLEVDRLPRENRRVNTVDALGDEVVGVWALVGIGVVAYSGFIGLMVLHGVGHHRPPLDVRLVGGARVVKFEWDLNFLGRYTGGDFTTCKGVKVTAD